MKFKVLKGTAIKPGLDAEPGQEIELSEAEARYFVLRGRLVPVDAGVKVHDPTTEGLITTMATPGTRDPKKGGGGRGAR